MRCAACGKKGSGQRGFALLIMLIIVVLGSLFGIVSSLSEVTEAKLARATGTNAALAQAKEALIAYAATYRDSHSGQVFGYLPCPDTDGDGVAELSCDSTGTTVVGLLPYKTLDLPDLRDSSQTCLWYAVSGSFKYNPKTTPMNWDTQGQIAVLDADGNSVLTPNDTDGGAAAVVIATGASFSNQTRTSNNGTLCNVTPSEVSAYLDGGYPLVNNATTAYTFPASSTISLTQGDVKDSSGNIINNDRILAITPKEIFARIRQRSDRGGINAQSSEFATGLLGTIYTDMATGTAPLASLPGNATAISGPYAGHVGELPSLTLDSAYTSPFTNWSEQYRMVVCSDLCGYCLNIGGQSCDAALLFGSDAIAGNPRTAHPASITDLFENDGATSGDGQGALSLANGSSNAFTGVSAYTSGHADIGICVAPSSEKPVTFSCDINTFNAASTHTGSNAEAVVDTLGKTATLGNNGGSASRGSGCIWYPTTFPFASHVRAYFSVESSDFGEGFVFTIADAATNSSGPTCGSTSNNAQASRMGYSGNTFPKIGLEIDARTPLSQRNTPYSSSTSARNDPPGDHVAFVFWGSLSSGSDDDNYHGAGTAGSATEPQNPSDTSASPPGIAILSSSNAYLPHTSWPNATTIHIRLDITKSYDNVAHRATFTMKAYLADTLSVCSATDYQNLSRDLSEICTQPATIEQDNILMDDVSGEPLANLYAGFTTAQSTAASSMQSIVISNFTIRSQ